MSVHKSLESSFKGGKRTPYHQSDLTSVVDSGKATHPPEHLRVDGTPPMTFFGRPLDVDV